MKTHLKEKITSILIAALILPVFAWADTEPNNTWQQANLLPENTKVNGTFTSSDTEDWYKIIINENCKINIHCQTDSVMRFNSMQFYSHNTDTTVNVRNSVGASWPGSFNLTITANDLKSGIYYVRVIRANEQGAYKLQYTITPAKWIDDIEPNDSFKTSLLIKQDSLYTGHIGYFYKPNGSDRDTQDWYKIKINENCKISIHCQTDSIIRFSSMQFYSHNTDTTVNVRNSVRASWPGSYNLKINVYDLLPGIYYVRVIRENEQGAYSLTYNLKPYIVDFDYSRYNNTVKMMNLSNGDRYEWSFGDGKTSNAKFPEHTYTKVGDYEISLKVFYEGSSTPRTIKKVVTVKGIDRFSPSNAGNGGDAAITIYGGGLDKNTMVKLIKGNEILTPDTILTGKLGQIQALFDLHFAEAGVYDVSIELPGSEPVVFNNGLTIEGLSYPYVVSSVEGYNTLRTGRTWPYNLVLKNTGNVMAKGVTAYLAIPNDVEFYSNLEPFSTTIDVSKTFEFYDEELGRTFLVSNQKVKEVMELLRTDYIEVDTLFNEPFKGRIYQVYVPKIDANSSLKIPFRVKSTSVDISSKTNLMSFVTPLHLFGSSILPTTAESQNKLVDIFLAGLEKVPYVDKNPFIKTFVKTANIGKSAIRNAASYFGYLAGGMSEQEAWNEAYIADGQLEKANAEVIAGLQDWALEMGLDKLKGLSEKQLLQYKEDRSFFTRISLKALKEGDKQGLSIWKDIALDNNMRFERLKMLQNILNEVNDFKGNLDFITGMNSNIQEYLQLKLKESPELKELMPYIIKHLLDNSGEGNLTKKPLRVGTSVDPNEIEGPQGFSVNRYINNKEYMEYIIRFENLPAAPLAAQIVNIYDTLDVNKFELSTFELSNVTIGDSLIRFPQGRSEYFTRFDLRPVINLKVDITAKLDTATGIVHWQFISIDPATGDLTDDPELGFLPPNLNAPDGEGSVSFRVKHKANLRDNEVISNKASIIFDFNAPIHTNTWENTIDLTNPAGAVSEIIQLNDSVFTVKWTGSDTGSNVRYYELYASVDNGEFINFGRFTGNSTTLQGELNKTYGFCVIPVDSVGNKQIKTIFAEKLFTLLPSNLASLNKSKITIHPNPAKDIVFIKYDNNSLSQNFIVNIYDAKGNKCYSHNYHGFDLNLGISVSIEKLLQGLYIIHISDSKENFMYKLSIQ